MGAVCCKPEDDENGDPTFGSARVKSWKRHKWRSEEPITESQLQASSGSAGFLGCTTSGGSAGVSRQQQYAPYKSRCK